MNNVLFDIDAFKEYVEWQNEDLKTLKKINELIIDIQRNGLLKNRICVLYPVKVIMDKAGLLACMASDIGTIILL